MSLSGHTEIITTIVNSGRDIYDSYNTLRKSKDRAEKVSAAMTLAGTLTGIATAIFPIRGANYINGGLNIANLALALGDLANKCDVYIKNDTVDNLDSLIGSLVNFIGSCGGVAINIGIAFKKPPLVKWGIILQTYSTVWKTLNEIAKKSDYNIFEWANARSDNEALFLSAISPAFGIVRFIAKAYAPAPPPKAAGLPNRRSPSTKVDFRNAQYRTQLDRHLFNNPNTTKAWEDALSPRSVFPTKR